MEPADRPIGYWLKHLDGLIESASDRTLAGHALSRRHWQAMNALRDAPLTADALRDALRPFWGEGVITLEGVVGDLAGRGWIAGEDGRYALTERGRAAHAAVAERAGETRRAVLDGLTEQDYVATVRTLSRMAANLERQAIAS
ncbi:MarR family winged helix-turn-helix transcriptional regulator [Actinoallomurus oryzae]|uniref:MarR family winged helix-turn-helix transcriptional regulator n=1 Tax=Actinoallomurus oryzae TaxID=502180 RepID=A0ABP8QZR9_9ACTN